jgi:hypothetical protein
MIRSVLAILLLFGLPHPGEGAVIFFSVGEQELKRDAARSAEIIKPFLTGKDDEVLTATDITGEAIIERLTGLTRRLKAGDVLIFHYSGHQRTQGDTRPLDEPEDPAKGVVPEGIIGILERDGGIRARARDDDFGDVISKFAKSVAILTVFDTCFAGELIDGTADIKRGVVFGSSAVDVCAPGEGASVFIGPWLRAFSGNEKGRIQADKNNDRKLTLGELADFLADQIDIPLNPIPSKPFVKSFEAAEHLGRVVAEVAPGSPGVVLLAGGLFVLALSALRGRSRRSPRQ